MLHLEAALKRFSRLARCVRTVFSLLAIALLKVHQVYEVARRHHVPIIGQGGITNANDALEFIIAGASAVGIGTSLFYDPMICKKINAGITEYLQRNGLKSVTDLVGSLQTGQDENGAHTPLSGERKS